MHRSRWRHWPMSRLAKRYGTLRHSATIAFLACWLSWIVNIDRPSVKGHSKQHNRLDLSLCCLGATCHVRPTLIIQLISGVAGLSESSYISPGSVATHMMCGEICSDNFMKNFFWFSQWKKFENWLIFGEVMRRTINSAIFGPSCIHSRCG